MAVVFRTDGAWGTGLGTNLTAAQVDNNFWEILERLATLETADPAVGTLTLTGNAVNNETVGTGSRTYTWKDVLTGAANEVKKGASASISLDNLIAAYNGDAGEGTLYGTGTAPNSLVSAAAGAGDTMVVTARVAGTQGNTIPLTETMTNGAWSGAFMTGGAGVGPDNIENIQVIGSQMTIYLQSGTALGPYTLPIAIIRWRGNWLAGEDYAELDLVFVPFVGVYLVKVTHTAPADFDASFTVGGQLVYHKLFAVPGQAAMNWKGDFEPGFAYVANDVIFVPGDGSYVVLIDNTSADTFDADAIDPASSNSLYAPLQPVDDPVVETGDYKESVKCATIANIVLSGEQTIDDFLTSASRVLVKNQTLKQNNGIYVSAAGAWARAADADTDAEVTSGMLVFVEEGTVNDSRMFVLKTPNPIVVGTTPLIFNNTAVGISGRPNLVIATTGNTNIRQVDNHDRRMLIMDAASAQTLTFDDDTAIGITREVWITRRGAGTVTLIQSGTTTILRPTGIPLTLTQNGFYRLRHQSRFVWLLISPSDHSNAIFNESGVAGATVSAALDQLESEIVSGGGLPSKVSKAGDTMTGTLRVPSGTVGTPGLEVGGAGNGLFLSTSLRITVGGAEVGRFSAFGLGFGSDPTITGIKIAKTGSNGGIEVIGDGSGAFHSLQRSAADAIGPNYIGMKSRGSAAVPAACSANDQLFLFSAVTWTGAAWIQTGGFNFTVVAGTPSTTDQENVWNLLLSPAGSVTQTAIIAARHSTGFSLFGNVTIDQDRLQTLRSYTVAGSPVASTKANKTIAQSDAPGGASQAFSDGSTWLNPMYRNRTTNLVVGFTSTAYDLGTVTTGTTTPAPANGNMQKMVNGGASTLAAPSATGDYTVVVQVTNNASASTLSLTGVTKQTGDALTTTNGHIFNMYYTKFGSNVHLNIVAMQ